MEFIKLCFSLIFVAGVFGICFVFPFKYNKYFENKYGIKAVNWLLSIIIGCLIFVAILEQNNTFLFVFLILMIIVIYIFSGWICYIKSKEIGADAKDITIAIAAQIFSSLGVVFLIIILADYFSRKKRRRRR